MSISPHARPGRGALVGSLIGCGLGLSGCATIDPTVDLQHAASLVESRITTPISADAAWNEPVETRSAAWDGSAPLTADVAVAVALQNDAALRVELNRINEAHANLVQAGRLPNPTISLALGKAIDGLGGGPAMVQGMQMLTWFWSRPDRIAAADVEVQTAVLLAAQQTVDTVAAVRTAHASLVAAQSLAAIEADQLAITRRTREVVEERLEAGESTQLDLDRASFDVETTRQTLVAATSVVEQRQLALLRLMGWSGAALGWSATEDGGLEAPPELVELLELAAAQRLDLAVARARIDQALAEFAIADSRRYPDVTATFGWQQNFAGREALMPGATLSIPILDSGDAIVASAAAHVEQRRLEWIDTADRLEFEVRDAVSRLRQAESQAAVVETGMLPAADAVLERSDAAYRKGTIDLTVLLAAQERRLMASRALIQHQFARRAALLELRRVVGGTFAKIDHTASEAMTSSEDHS